MHLVVRILLALALVAATAGANGQAPFPSKPFRVIVPYTPGSTPDMLARLVGPKLTANGHVLVANDTHVPLQNPSIWYLVHLVGIGDKPFRAMGPSIPGVPAIVLGMKQHVAWGATTDQVDQTDVYQESIVPCDDGKSPCVVLPDADVDLAARQDDH